MQQTKINYILTKENEILSQQIWPRFQIINEKMHLGAEQGIDARIMKFSNLTGIVI